MPLYPLKIYMLWILEDTWLSKSDMQLQLIFNSHKDNPFLKLGITFSWQNCDFATILCQAISLWQSHDFVIKMLGFKKK